MRQITDSKGSKSPRHSPSKINETTLKSLTGRSSLIKTSDRKNSNKRKIAILADKEMKEVISKVEGKIEELRKASMNEINRLEAMLEHDDCVKLSKYNKFENSMKNAAKL